MTAHVAIPLPITLVQLAPNTCGTVAAVAWDSLSDAEARRLREFGLDDGVEVELLHRGALGGGPLACRIGRMRIAVRRHVALAIHVSSS